MSAWDEVDKLKAEALKTAQVLGPPRVTGPAKLSADALRTLRQKQRIANGFHPNGKRLLPAIAGFTSSCGSCAHLREKETPARRKFFKCALMGDTNGPGTDIRKSWPACELWKDGAK